MSTLVEKIESRFAAIDDQLYAAPCTQDGRAFVSYCVIFQDPEDKNAAEDCLLSLIPQRGERLAWRKYPNCHYDGKWWLTCRLAVYGEAA